MTRKIGKFLAIICCVSILLSSCFIVATADSEYTTWLQTDSRWNYIEFGSIGDTMYSAGCAITSISILMVHSGAVSSDSSEFNPGVLVNFLNNNNGFTYDGSIYWSSPGKYTDSFRYAAYEALSGSVSDKTEMIKRYTDSGYVVVAQVKSGGHYVAVNQVVNNEVLIFDPAGWHDKLFDYDPWGVTALFIYQGPCSHPSTNNYENPPDHEEPTPVASNYPTGWYTVNDGDGLNVRSGPDSSYDYIGSLAYNESAHVSEVNGSWGKIDYYGQSGWICLDYTYCNSADIQIGYYRINDYEGVNLRSGPGTGYEIVSGIGYDETVYVSDINSNWGKTSEGWFCLDYADYIGNDGQNQQNPEPYQDDNDNYDDDNNDYDDDNIKKGNYRIWDTDGLNLRSGPGTDYDIITAIAYDSIVYLSDINGSWGYITYQDYSGWVCIDYIEYVVTEIKGDANGDGTVNSVDSLLVLRYSSGKISAQSFAYHLCDINNDGVVSGPDALLIMRYFMGKISYI